MKRKQVREIHVCIAEKVRERPFSDCIRDVHLRFVERRLSQMPLSIADKLMVIDGIVKILQEKI